MGVPREAELAYCKSREKRLVCVGPEVGDCMDDGTVYLEDGDLRDGTLVEDT